jgi:hypothetical protein
VFVSLLVIGIVLFPVLAQRKTSGPNPSLSNLKQVDLGIMMFANDYNDSTPDMHDEATFQRMVIPYVKNKSVFTDPVDNRLFQLNDKLSHVDLSKLKHPDATILIFGSANDTGGRFVGYADGHATILQEKDFLLLLQNTQKLPPVLGPMVGNWRFSRGELDLQKDGRAELVSYSGPNGLAKWSNDDWFSAFGPKKPNIEGKVTWNSINEFTLDGPGVQLVFDRLPEQTK